MDLVCVCVGMCVCFRVCVCLCVSVWLGAVLIITFMFSTTL